MTTLTGRIYLSGRFVLEKRILKSWKYNITTVKIKTKKIKGNRNE